ncbi:MAG: glycosyl transferase group 1 [Verrucomicrobiales bacterium]|nr:glycosyl transferase group 1 [Verrucomicrobiales bacterium]
MKQESGLLNKLFGWGQKETPKMVNLGCGNRFHPDWLNIDFNSQTPEVRKHDLMTALPLKDGSCSVIYSSHLIEHFPKSFTPLFLAECFRVLVPQGIIRLVVPDLEMIARLYLENLQKAATGDSDSAKKHEWMQIELLDQMVREQSGGEMLEYWKKNPMPAEEFVIHRMGHEVTQFLTYIRSQPPSPTPLPYRSIQNYTQKTPEEVTAFRRQGEVHRWMYDRVSLKSLLETVGFHNAHRCQAGESQIANFNSYQLDLNPDGTIRKPDSLFMEAIKP